MFEINYKLADNCTEIPNGADDITLRYEIFLGSLSFKKDNNELSMDWKWIPLADFALCMFEIYNRLNKKTKGEEIFEFTESDATITFQREDDKCKIHPSFSEVVLIMDYAEFQEAVKLFCQKIAEDIFIQNKDLKEDYKEFLMFAGLA